MGAIWGWIDGCNLGRDLGCNLRPDQRRDLGCNLWLDQRRDLGRDLGRITGGISGHIAGRISGAILGAIWWLGYQKAGDLGRDLGPDNGWDIRPYRRPDLRRDLGAIWVGSEVPSRFRTPVKVEILPSVVALSATTSTLRAYKLFNDDSVAARALSVALNVDSYLAMSPS